MLDLDNDPIHGQQEGRFFHGYYRHYCYLPLYIFSGESAVRPVAVFQYRWGRGIGGGTGTDRRPDSAELAGGLDRIRADSGFCRETCSAGVKTILRDGVGQQ